MTAAAREDAIRIASIAALSDRRAPYYGSISAYLDARPEADDLAIEAFLEVMRLTRMVVTDAGWPRWVDGEVVALLEEGWCPGDDVGLR